MRVRYTSIRFYRGQGFHIKKTHTNTKQGLLPAKAKNKRRITRAITAATLITAKLTCVPCALTDRQETRCFKTI